MEHTRGILIVALAEELRILYNFLGRMVCLTRICRSNVGASVNVSMRPVVVLPGTFQREDTMPARSERFRV
jgi:hypothetical protein